MIIRAPRRFLLLTALAMLALPQAVHAQPVPPQPVPPSAAPVQALNESLLANMRAGRSTPFASRAQALQPMVVAGFDLPTILQNSVGPRWSAIAEPVRTQLLAAFTRFTVATWVANFEVDGGERFELLPDRRQVGADEVVATRIVPRSGDPTRLEYVMRNKGGAWKAVDILVNGAISRVAVQRADFRSLVASGDGSALAAMLNDKADALAAGKR